MTINEGIQLYLLVAISISITSYIRLYRPAISLIEEILNGKTKYHTFKARVLWLIAGTLLAPIMFLVLLSNNNDKFVQKYVGLILEEYLED